MQKHWKELTLFLRQAGAPLDNNLCEQSLKKAILHRKNSLFYKTRNGAQVGDLFMTLIHTCQLYDVNPFDYLIQLLKHPRDLSRKPQKWMPWLSHGPCILLVGGSEPRRSCTQGIMDPKKNNSVALQMSTGNGSSLRKGAEYRESSHLCLGEHIFLIFPFIEPVTVNCSHETRPVSQISPALTNHCLTSESSGWL